MDSIIGYFMKSIPWVFSGIGVFALSLFFIKKSSSINKVSQKDIKAKGDVVGRDKKVR